MLTNFKKIDIIYKKLKKRVFMQQIKKLTKVEKSDIIYIKNRKEVIK